MYIVQCVFSCVMDLPHSSSVSRRHQSKLPEHVGNAQQTDFRPGNFRPVHRDLKHWNVKTLAQEYQLNIKAPPASETGILLSIASTASNIIIKYCKIPFQMDVCEKSSSSSSSKHLEPTLKTKSLHENRAITLTTREAKSK